MHIVFNPGQLGEAQIGPFAHNLRTNLRCGYAQDVVCPIANVRISFMRGAHIGADAAEPQQITG